MEFDQLKQHWIDVAKDWEDSEFAPKTNPTEEQYEWFGNAVASMHGKEYMGSECRRWFRAWWVMLEQPNKIKDCINYVLNTDPEDANYLDLYTAEPVYILSGYGISSFTNTKLEVA